MFTSEAIWLGGKFSPWKLLSDWSVNSLLAFGGFIYFCKMILSDRMTHPPTMELRQSKKAGPLKSLLKILHGLTTHEKSGLVLLLEKKTVFVLTFIKVFSDKQDTWKCGHSL